MPKDRAPQGSSQRPIEGQIEGAGRLRGRRCAVLGAVAGLTLQVSLPAASAQEFTLVPPGDATAPEIGPQLGISVHATIDVLYVPPGATAPILIQKTFETRASALNMSSQYVFDVLNEAALSGVDQALAGGAQTGRISVVAVCYSYGVDGQGVQLLAPMGVFINTTDLSVQPEGVASLRTNVRVIPPVGPVGAGQ